MRGKPLFFLHNISVVVTAEYHNPSILNPDFLKHQKLVPAKWKHTETITTPALSSTQFGNGVKLVVEPGKMTISEPKRGEFGAKTYVHQIAERYVSRLPLVPYRGVGLNCLVSMSKRNPADWVKSRFLKPGKWLSREPQITGATLKLQLEAPSAVCNLSIGPSTVRLLGTDEEDAVGIDCNFHHDGPLDVKRIKAIIRAWPEHEAFLLSALKKLLTGQLK